VRITFWGVLAVVGTAALLVLLLRSWQQRLPETPFKPGAQP
jgi:hypothetical protein